MALFSLCIFIAILICTHALAYYTGRLVQINRELKRLKGDL